MRSGVQRSNGGFTYLSFVNLDNLVADLMNSKYSRSLKAAIKPAVQKAFDGADRTLGRLGF